MKAAEFTRQMEGLLYSWRYRLVIQRALNLLPALAIVGLLASLTDLSVTSTVLILLGIVSASLGLLPWSEKWRRLNNDNFARHLNRRFPELEESAGLLLLDENGLSPMQGLQRIRVARAFSECRHELEASMPKLNYGIALASVIAFACILPFSDQIKTRVQTITVTESHSTENMKTTRSGLTSAEITVTPPAYTGLAAYKTDQLDLEIVEGSQLNWNLSFAGRESDYALAFTEHDQLPLLRNANGRWQASASISNTGIYRIIRPNKQSGSGPDGIYSISVQLDQPPDIRIEEPRLSALEIPRDAPPEFNTRVLVSDDYGIRNTEVLASVAKGSGEAVKFRDISLQFERSQTTGKGIRYEMDWNLPELGMEPGDELYFTVIANDNKVPEANQGRSQTLIVRWLDETEAALAADGLAIDFIPEFFISQRQIIIDTEQLIADRDMLDPEVFKQTSYSIGHSQADLKQKYGQYLGDEFGEGPGPQTGDDHAQETHEDDHHHQESAAGGLDQDIEINTVDDILTRFGHNHGDPEVGPITQRNPLALMKRAVSEMWLAEKHLMQAGPDLALPYEYEAYKYLKLARQADRIYVKRLGFVPPPVTEDRRLSGKLDEVSSKTLAIEKDLDKKGNRHYQELLADIYLILSDTISYYTLDNARVEKLIETRDMFNVWAQQKAGLIKQVATLEKILLANSTALKDCGDCIEDLKATVWSLIDTPVHDLHHRNPAWLTTDEMLRAYLQGNSLTPTRNQGITADGEQP